MSTPTPGWNPDPSGRHEYRYWDGSSWTDDVSDNGVTATDPIGSPGAPTGPTAPADPDPTAPFEPTQAYGQAPPPGGYPAGPPSGGYPAAGGPAGGYPPAGGPGGPGGYDPYDPYGTGGYPPETPPSKGVPKGLLIGGAIAVVALIIGLVALFAGGGDDGDDETTTGDDTATTEADTSDTSDTTVDDTTVTTEAGGSESTDVFALGVGDCVTDETEMTGEVTEVPIIDCNEPHASEVFHSFMMTDSELPDEAGIEAIVQDQCLPAFQSFVGLDYDDSVLEVNYLSPTPDSWEAGDRELLCLVYDPSGDVTGTLAGANR